MPDITMCQRTDCPLSDVCRRHGDSGTKPGDWQAWWLPEDDDPVGEECPLLWRIEKDV